MTRHETVLVNASLATLLVVFGSALVARADVFQWEYLNPDNTSWGTQQSSILCPDGAGVNAAPGANLSFRDLTMAYLSHASLTGANLRGTDLTRADFFVANLTSAILTEANLASASFYLADLTGANLSGANASGADFYGASVGQANFSQANLIAATFAQVNLANADFSAPPSFFYIYTNLTGANLSQTNLTNARFNGRFDGFEWVPAADLTGANLSGSDTRGTDFTFTFAWTAPITTNVIHPDGHIAGLDLTAEKSLVVRDYDGNPGAFPPNGPLPIRVEQHLTLDTSGILRLVFDSDPWDSTIAFTPGISVTLGGTLELAFAPEVNLDSQIGRTIDLFNWTGVAPTGAFTISSPYTWNLTNLYTTGEVTLTALAAIPGDFNKNGVVDAADYILWRKTDGTPAGYNDWRTHFGQTSGSGSVASANASVPESTSIVMVVVAAVGVSTRRLLTWRVLLFDSA